MLFAISGFIEGLRPTKRIPIDQWSDENVYLPSENSAEPGQYRTARMPYLRQPMRDLSPTSIVCEVVWMKGVQLGVTTIALNTMGAYIDLDPCPIMYIMPTKEIAESLSKDRFTPMVERSPALMRKIAPARERDSGNTITSKSFPGGRAYFVGANSAAALRSKPIRILLADEIDAWPHDADGEGSPLSLAEKRQSTFGDKRKTFKLSTPTIKGASVIEMEYDTTDKRKYFVPCPHCQTAQTIEFENLRWDENDKTNVWLECPHCHEPIEEYYKTWMMDEANGAQWIATAPENANPKRTGYHLNSLYSPLGMLSWVSIVDQYLKALKDENLYKTFVNSILGESYEAQGDAPEWERLYNRSRDSYAAGTIPEDAVAFLTAGVDIQRDRIEAEVVGWSDGKISHSIDYRVLDGDTSKPEVWAKLDALLNEKWTRPDGCELPIRKMAIDSGYNTTTVYDFCERNDPDRVIATKGDEALREIVATPKQVQTKRDGKKTGSVRLWRVGVSLLKSELYGWLRLPVPEPGAEEVTPTPPGFCFFPEYGSAYFKMLTAEKLSLVRNKKGIMISAWTLPAHARNEALDCRVYARAAAAVFGMDRMRPDDWEAVRKSYAQAAVKNVGRPASRKNMLGEGSFWDR